jgi:hypothetical protein
MSLVSRLLNVKRRKITVVVPLAVTAVLAAAAAFASPAMAASGPTSGTLIAHTSSVTVSGATTATVTGSVNPAGRTTYYKAVYGLASSQWCSSSGSQGKAANSTGQQLLRYTDFWAHPVSVNLAGLTAGSNYCVAISATNSSGTSTGSPIQFTAGAPAARSDGVTPTSSTTATVDGAVNPDGQTTTYKAVYDLATSSWCTSHGASGSPTFSAGGSTLGFTDTTFHNVSVNITGLTRATRYCAAISASAATTSTGAPVAFIAGAPSVSTSSVSITAETAVIVNGAVDPAGQTTTYHVLYDLSSSIWCSSNGTSGMPTYSTGAQTLPYTDGTLHNVSVNLTGLVGGTSYCASITATNASGAASTAILSFTPDVVNTNVDVTGPTTATVNGAVNASGQTSFFYGAVYDLANSTFCASNGSTFDATTVHDVGISFPYTDSAFHPVSVNLNAYGGTALAASTEYCVTLEAGLQAYPPLYFTTTGATAATGSASGVGTGSATVSGTVNPKGTATTYHFDYGTSTNYGSQAPAPPDPSAGSGTTAQTESTTLTGLSPNTLYHYRIEATNATGTSYGTDQTFTTTGAGTSPTPIVATGLAVNVGSAAATVWGTVDDKGEVATYRFDYGTSTNYTSQTISEPVSDSNSTPTSVDARLTRLSPNTVYHYRIEATDAWGTSYGADQTFTTTG